MRERWNEWKFLLWVALTMVSIALVSALISIVTGWDQDAVARGVSAGVIGGLWSRISVIHRQKRELIKLIEGIRL